MNNPTYIIQGMSMKSPIVYVNFDESDHSSFVYSKTQATKFISKSLALGWMTQIQMENRSYQFSLVTL